MQITKDRNFPRAYDLQIVKSYLNVLHKCPIPLIEIERRKLKQMRDRETSNAIREWKRSNGIDSADESEYRYLLRDLCLIADRESIDVDFVLPLGGGGPIVGSFVSSTSRTRVFFLTKRGESLYAQLTYDRLAYESELFWLVLRNQFYLRLIQQIILDRKSYRVDDIRDLIKTNDSTSKNCAIQWLHYFDIARFGHGCRLDNEMLARRLFASAIFEINENFERGETYYVKEIDRRLNEVFSLSPSATDFVAALDTIFRYAEKSVLQGYTSGRDDISLPSRPSISMIKFTSTIPLAIAFQANAAEVLRIIKYIRD